MAGLRPGSAVAAGPLAPAGVSAAAGDLRARRGRARFAGRNRAVGGLLLAGHAGGPGRAARPVDLADPPAERAHVLPDLRPRRGGGVQRGRVRLPRRPGSQLPGCACGGHPARARAAPRRQGGCQAWSGGPSPQAAGDGKTVRGAVRPDGSQVHLLPAFDVATAAVRARRTRSHNTNTPRSYLSPRAPGYSRGRVRTTTWVQDSCGKLLKPEWPALPGSRCCSPRW
jgi:hypothetical protein